MALAYILERNQQHHNPIAKVDTTCWVCIAAVSLDCVTDLNSIVVCAALLGNINSDKFNKVGYDSNVVGDIIVSCNHRSHITLDISLLIVYSQKGRLYCGPSASTLRRQLLSDLWKEERAIF